jgi:carbonic anhydrase
MSDLSELIEKNRAWADRIKAQEPDFFTKLSGQQSPRYLWIGCADSRVPATQLVGLLPGEMFVHRNVANVVAHTDFNCLSAVQFAVDVLRVEHVIVCGHYGCGGVEAALSGAKLGLIDNWLRHVQDVAQQHAAALASLPSDESRLERLCELNVVEQVLNVGRTTVVQEAWARGQELTVHGWIYRLDNGLLRDLGIRVASPEETTAAHALARADAA